MSLKNSMTIKDSGPKEELSSCIYDLQKKQTFFRANNAKRDFIRARTSKARKTNKEIIHEGNKQWGKRVKINQNKDLKALVDENYAKDVGDFIPNALKDYCSVKVSRFGTMGKDGDDAKSGKKVKIKLSVKQKPIIRDLAAFI